jgi:NDP-sugar pyrophosphorylase family protein
LKGLIINMAKKAMILAAGEGSRLLPLTKDKPKALVPFHGVPMLEILMIRLVKAGFKDLVINVHHYKDQIIDFVNSNNGFGARVQFSVEDNLLDTGGGIKNAMSKLGSEPVLFHNVDVLTDIDLERFYCDHMEWGGKASLAVKERPTSRQLLFNKNAFLSGWQHPEKRIKIVSRNGRGFLETAFSGVYILDPVMFDLFPVEDAFSFTPWILELSGSNDIRGWEHDQDYWFDLGTPSNLSKAEKKLKMDTEQDGTFILP